jgi:hypothetical protein
VVEPDEALRGRCDLEVDRPCRDVLARSEPGVLLVDLGEVELVLDPAQRVGDVQVEGVRDQEAVGLDRGRLGLGRRGGAGRVGAMNRSYEAREHPLGRLAVAAREAIGQLKRDYVGVRRCARPVDALDHPVVVGLDVIDRARAIDQFGERLGGEQRFDLVGAGGDPAAAGLVAAAIADDQLEAAQRLVLTASTLVRNDPGLLVGNDPLTHPRRMVVRSVMEVVDGVRPVVGDGRGRCAQEASVLHLPAMVPA